MNRESTELTRESAAIQPGEASTRGMTHPGTRLHRDCRMASLPRREVRGPMTEKAVHDRELVTALQRGDAGAVERLVDRYGGWV